MWLARIHEGAAERAAENVNELLAENELAFAELQRQDVRRHRDAAERYWELLRAEEPEQRP